MKQIEQRTNRNKMESSQNDVRLSLAIELPEARKKDMNYVSIRKITISFDASTVVESIGFV